MLWAWPDDAASTASAQSNLLSPPSTFPQPIPLRVADNHSKLHKCMANKCEASERSSRKPPGAARHCRCQNRCRCRASILAPTHHVRFSALGLDTHSRTNAPVCSCKLKQHRFAFKCKRRAAKKLTHTTQIEKPLSLSRPPTQVYSWDSSRLF